MNKLFFSRVFIIYSLFLTNFLESSTDQRFVHVNQAFKAVREKKADDAQIQIVLRSVLVSPDVLQKNPDIELFVSIKNLMRSIQLRYGQSSQILHTDESEILEYIEDHYQDFEYLIKSNIIVMSPEAISHEQRIQELVNFMVPLYQHWTEIFNMATDLAQQKATLIDFAGTALFRALPFVLKKLIKDMGMSANKLLTLIQSAPSLAIRTDFLNVSKNDDQALVVFVVSSHNLHILTTIEKAKLLLDLYDEQSCYKAVREKKADDAQIQIVLRSVLVTPNVLQKNPDIDLFVSIKNLMRSIQLRYGQSSQILHTDESEILEYIEDHYQDFEYLIESNIIVISPEAISHEQRIQELVNFMVPLYQHWTEIFNMAIDLAQKKATLIDFAGKALFRALPFVLKKLIKDMSAGIDQLLRLIEKADFVQDGTQLTGQDQDLVLMMAKHGSYLLTTVDNSKILFDLSNSASLTPAKKDQGVETAADNLGVLDPKDSPDREQDKIQAFVETKLDTLEHVVQPSDIKTQPLVLISEKFRHSVAQWAMHVALRLIDQKIEKVTQNILIKALHDQNLSIAELLHDTNMAYAIGYVQNCVLILQNKMKGDLKSIKIMNAEKMSKMSKMVEMLHLIAQNKLG